MKIHKQGVRLAPAGCGEMCNTFAVAHQFSFIKYKRGRNHFYKNVGMDTPHYYYIFLLYLLELFKYTHGNIALTSLKIYLPPLSKIQVWKLVNRFFDGNLDPDHKLFLGSNVMQE